MGKRHFADRNVTRMERPVLPSATERSATVKVHVSRSTSGYQARACLLRAGSKSAGTPLCGEDSGRTPTVATEGALHALARNLKVRSAHRKWARK